MNGLVWLVKRKRKWKWSEMSNMKQLGFFSTQSSKSIKSSSSSSSPPTCTTTASTIQIHCNGAVPVLHTTCQVPLTVKEQIPRGTGTLPLILYDTIQYDTIDLLLWFDVTRYMWTIEHQIQMGTLPQIPFGGAPSLLGTSTLYIVNCTLNLSCLATLYQVLLQRAPRLELGWLLFLHIPETKKPLSVSEVRMYLGTPTYRYNYCYSSSCDCRMMREETQKGAIYTINSYRPFILQSDEVQRWRKQQPTIHWQIRYFCATIF